MHAIRANSAPSMIAGLVAKRDHADRRPNTKPEQHRRKTDRREFRQEIALCIWGRSAMHEGVEL